MTEQIIFWSLISYLGIAAAFLIYYSPRLVCWFGSFRKQEHLVNPKKNMIAVIIPARNESVIIRGILNCLVGQDYPADRFDVHVVVKDLSDPTIGIVRGFGFIPHVSSEQKCKSDALDSCLKDMRLAGQDYDGYLVIDADCWLDSDCLTEINNAMASGRDIVTSKKLVKNYYAKDRKDRPLSALANGIIWTVIDELGNRFKSDHNLAHMTITSGILFSRSVIAKLNGFPFNKTMTEDMELMFSNPLNGFTSYYCSYAHIYMEEANTLQMTDKRRARWVTGYVASKRLYSKKLRDEMRTPKKLLERYYLNGLYPVFWMYGLTAVFMASYLLLALIMYFMSDGAAIYALGAALIPFAFTYLSFFILTAFAIGVDHRYMKSSIWTKAALLFYHPFFYMGYFKICFEALFMRRAEKWDAIERSAALENK